jgi:hypothetical protein
MSDIKQRVWLRVRKTRDKRGDRLLRYGKARVDGTVSWAKTDWAVRSTSQLPKPLFFAITNSLTFQLRRVPKVDKQYPNLKPKITLALTNAASTCGCGFLDNKFGGRTWTLQDKPFIEFAIIDFSNHKGTTLGKLTPQIRERRKRFRRMERKSKALFRVAMVVLRGGFVKIVPAKPLEEKRG